MNSILKRQLLFSFFCVQYLLLTYFVHKYRKYNEVGIVVLLFVIGTVYFILNLAIFSERKRGESEAEWSARYNHNNWLKLLRGIHGLLNFIAAMFLVFQAPSTWVITLLTLDFCIGIRGNVMHLSSI